jgi:hypothetical protein
MTPQGTIETMGKIPVAITYGGTKYMIISQTHIETLRKAIVARDGKPVAANVELYKELGITPTAFGYYDGNWEHWLNANTSVTLTPADLAALRTAISEVNRAQNGFRTYAYSRYTDRLSSASQAIYQKLGIRPSELGISTAETWSVY